MATYKVLQDIEAEDKLILWLTPRQSIYAAIVIVSMVLAFVMAKVSILLVIPWVFPIVAFGFLAAPLGRDQPNDIWLAAQIRFYIKNRKRIWDQSGMQELVHITAPKKAEKFYTDGLSQTEVKSRLRALAGTIDSRGWAVKNVTVNLSAGPGYMNDQGDDRLVAFNELPQEVPVIEVSAADDILDPMSNMIAQRFDTEIKKQEIEHREHLRSIMQQAAPPKQQTGQPADDYYFLRDQQVTSPIDPATGGQLATFSAQVVGPGQANQPTSFLDDNTATATTADPDAQALLDKLHKDKAVADVIAHTSHEKRLKTAEEVAIEERAKALAIQAQRAKEQEEARAKEEARRRQTEADERRKRTEMRAQKTAPDAIIKELSSDTGLNIATLSAMAKHKTEDSLSDGVEISFH